MKKTKEMRGITLIALVILIIILLIVSTISIQSLTNTGIFNRAQEAKIAIKNSQKEESEMLENYLAQINTITFSNVDITKTNPEAAMPKGAIIVEGDANNGIVIKDSNNNEWAWVEVPKTTVFTTATKADEYGKIENDLKQYVKDYRLDASTSEISSDWKDEWYEGCGIETSQKYTEMYYKMLSNVYTNGGFWISRYEMGDETSTKNNYTVRTNITGAEGTPVSKKNIIPYNFITCSQAQTLASGMTTDSNKTSSLLFGIQWDLVCKYIETNSELKYEDIAVDSSGWGNTCFANFVINNGMYMNSSSIGWIDGIKNNHTKVEKTSTITTTGVLERNKVLNIYDFSGNMMEWTLERYKNENITTGRGGSYTSWNDYGYASSRCNSATYKGLENLRVNYGCRITMY